MSGLVHVMVWILEGAAFGSRESELRGSRLDICVINFTEIM